MHLSTRERLFQRPFSLFLVSPPFPPTHDRSFEADAVRDGRAMLGMLMTCERMLCVIDLCRVSVALCVGG